MHQWFFDNLFPVFFVLVFIMAIISFVKKNFTGNSFRSREMNDQFERRNLRFEESQSRKTAKPRTALNFECPNCGANLAKKADVSPSGDVKCMYCEQWFNIHENA